MSKGLSAIFVLLLFSSYLRSQVMPGEGSRLNYRVIGFSFPVSSASGKNLLEIATGNIATDEDFRKNLLKSAECASGKIIMEVPAFGQDYTWRTISTNSNPGPVISEMHHFSVGSYVSVDTESMRFRIIKSSDKYKNDHVFLDFSQTLYDMDGRPVWFLPDPGKKADGNSNIRDLKLTTKGTVTFVMGDRAIEADYNGNIIWEAPNVSTAWEHTEHYHHEFTKLSNGHYMVLGTESVSWQLPYLKNDSTYLTDDASIEKDTNGIFRQKLKFGTIAEFDEKGKEIWYWKSSVYFKNSDLYRDHLPNGKFSCTDVHENAFYFDEKERVIYVGFRDISTILKIGYPGGNVLASYGKQYKPGVDKPGNDLFCGQHSIRVANGQIYVYNNNAFTPTDIPKLEILESRPETNGSLKKVWEYECSFDGVNTQQMDKRNRKIARLKGAEGKQSPAKTMMTSGGNFLEMPDGALFASMNSPFSKVFIMGRNKEILWGAILETRNQQDSAWNALPVYRATIIPAKDEFENLYGVPSIVTDTSLT